MFRERNYLGAILIVLCPATALHAQAPVKSLPTPRAPGKSLPATAGPGRVTRSFQAAGIQTVLLRAEAAEKAKVATESRSRAVAVSGIPQGGAAGYHPADPNWRETPAAQWGLDFHAKVFGPTLVISSVAEMSYIHHYYHLDDIRITVPDGVKVIKENRKLTGDGGPDLSAPSAR
jgi:hypothetical protein